MRASIALLPAIAAMSMASRCRPRTTTSSLESSTLTSAVIISTVSSTEPTSSAISIIGSTKTTASEESTTTEASSVEPSTTEPATSEPPFTTEPPTTSAPLTTVEPPITSEPPAITEEPTTTTAESATSTEPSILPTITDFCLKAITPDVPNKRYHIRAVSPSSNMLTENYNFPNFARFNLDTATGRLTMNGGPWAGYEVYTPPPFDSQTTRVIRFTDGPVDYPLRCSNPNGVYTTGSVLKCEVIVPWSDGVVRKYSTFTSNIGSPIGAWTILLDGHARTGAYNYDLGMFFSYDCNPEDVQK